MIASISRVGGGREEKSRKKGRKEGRKEEN